jgi:hypothetical protein
VRRTACPLSDLRKVLAIEQRKNKKRRRKPFNSNRDTG